MGSVDLGPAPTIAPASRPHRLLPFVQLEFSHAIGVPTGRYLIDPPRVGDRRAGPPESGDPRIADSLVVEIVEAPAAKSRFSRRSKTLPSKEPPAPVSLAIATLILASQPLSDSTHARAKLTRWREDGAEQHALLERALSCLNRAVRGYRAAACDPYVLELSEADPRAIRIGYGTAAGLFAGAWSEAFLVRPDTVTVFSSTQELHIGVTLAAVLDGRADVFEAEELALRTLLDLAHGRERAAAAQARGAVEVLRAELEPYAEGSAVASVEPVADMDAALAEATARHVLETAAAYRRMQIRNGTDVRRHASSAET